MPVARKDNLQWFPGNYYHIYNRGARKKSIFREKANYLFVLEKMGKYCKALDLTPIAYCLMPTHYHFLIRQNGENSAGLLTQRIFNSYKSVCTSANHEPIFTSSLSIYPRKSG